VFDDFAPIVVLFFAIYSLPWHWNFFTASNQFILCSALHLKYYLSLKMNDGFQKCLVKLKFMHVKLLVIYENMFIFVRSNSIIKYPMKNIVTYHFYLQNHSYMQCKYPHSPTEGVLKIIHLDK
jgi:hypothetical protein